MSELGYRCQAWCVQQGFCTKFLDGQAFYPGTMTLDEVRADLLKNVGAMSKESGQEILIVITRGPEIDS